MLVKRDAHRDQYTPAPCFFSLSPVPARGPGRTHNFSAHSSKEMVLHWHTQTQHGSAVCTRPVRDAHKPPILILRPPGPLPAGPGGGGCDDLPLARCCRWQLWGCGGHALHLASCPPGLTDGATTLLPEATAQVFASVLMTQSAEQPPDLVPCPGPLPRPLPPAPAPHGFLPSQTLLLHFQTLLLGRTSTWLQTALPCGAHSGQQEMLRDPGL